MTGLRLPGPGDREIALDAGEDAIVDQLHEGAEVLPEKSLAERHLPGGDGDPGGEKVSGLKGPNQ